MHYGARLDTYWVQKVQGTVDHAWMSKGSKGSRYNGPHLRMQLGSEGSSEVQWVMLEGTMDHV